MNSACREGGMIRVLVAEEQTLVRAGLVMLIAQEDDMEAVGEAADGAQVIAAARELKPGVILIDVSLPVLDGLEAARQIAADERLADVKVLMLASHASEEHIVDALRAGASGFLLKDTDPCELVRAIRLLAEGEVLFAPSVTRTLISWVVSHPSRGDVCSGDVRWLTEREREVTALVAAGRSNEEIAERLVISRATAKTHVSRAMRKLQARDRSQLVVRAYESGLVVPGRPAATDVPRLRAVG
jgi:DNA-binding NarL/FixJ family response regulator